MTPSELPLADPSLPRHAIPSARGVSRRQWPAPLGGAKVALLALASWAGGGCTVPKPQVHRVTIRGFQYLPATVTVQEGDTVAWANEDVVPHTATARAQHLDSGSIESAQSWRFVAARKGTYAYECAFHPTMRGTLVVR